MSFDLMGENEAGAFAPASRMTCRLARQRRENKIQKRANRCSPGTTGQMVLTFVSELGTFAQLTRDFARGPRRSAAKCRRE